MNSIVSSDLDDEPEGGGSLGLAGLWLQLVVGRGDRSRRGSVRGRERRRVAPENDPFQYKQANSHHFEIPPNSSVTNFLKFPISMSFYAFSCYPSPLESLSLLE